MRRSTRIMIRKLLTVAACFLALTIPFTSFASRRLMRPVNAEEAKTIVLRYLDIPSRAHIFMFRVYQGNEGISSARIGWDYVRLGVQHVCTGSYNFDTEEGATDSDVTP